MPFAGYKNFDDCVLRNRDKGNPKAYCGKIMHMIEDGLSDRTSENDSVPLFSAKIIDKENRIVEAWGSVEVVDKEGQLVPIQELVNIMPKLMDRDAPIFYRHMRKGGTHVGKIISWREDIWRAKDNPTIAKMWDLPPDFERPGIKITFRIFNHYPIDDECWEGILSGALPAVSFGGKTNNLITAMSRDGTGRIAGIATDLNGYEWAVIPKPMNPFAYITRIGDKEVHYNYIEGGWDLVKEQFGEDLHNFAQTLFLYEGLDYKTSMEIAKEYLENSTDCKLSVNSNNNNLQKVNISDNNITKGESNSISFDTTNKDDNMPQQVNDVSDKEDTTKGEDCNKAAPGMSAPPAAPVQAGGAPTGTGGDVNSKLDQIISLLQQALGGMNKEDVVKELDLPHNPDSKGTPNPPNPIGGKATPKAGESSSPEMKIDNPSQSLNKDDVEGMLNSMVETAVTKAMQKQQQTNSEMEKSYTPRPAVPQREGLEPLVAEINKGTAPSIDDNGYLYYDVPGRNKLPDEYRFENMGKTAGETPGTVHPERTGVANK